jgi:hypothetical protein
MEGFVPIDGFPDYLIHADGRVYCTRTSSFLDPGQDTSGYIQLSLRSTSGRRYTRRLHRLLAQHFIPKPDGAGDIVDHIDNNRTNNALGNLRWCTPEENGQNTSARRRDTYSIRQIEARGVWQVFIPNPNGSPTYVGHALTQPEAQAMRDRALAGHLPSASRPDTYCITRRDDTHFYVSIPIAPRKYNNLGVRATLAEAQALRDAGLRERDADPTAWRPRMMGTGVIYATPN